MTHAPMLADTNNPAAEAYSAVLARDVTLFSLQFWDREKMEYVPEWLYTNQLPQKVVIALATAVIAARSARGSVSSKAESPTMSLMP